MTDSEVAKLILSQINGHPQIGTFTWVNHYSARVNALNNIDFTKFTFVGVDGQLLAYLLAKAIKTTSADRVLPLLLQKKLRVVCIGGSEKNSLLRIEIFKNKFPEIELVRNYNGYSTDETLSKFLKDFEVVKPQLIIIGTGSPRQERLAIEIKMHLSKISLDHSVAIVTCGGWLDQILMDSYYPKWSYRLKINWAVRFAREPFRLWKRYSVDAMMAVLEFRNLRKYLRHLVS